MENFVVVKHQPWVY